MPVGIAEVEADSTSLPFLPFLDGKPVFGQPRFPAMQFLARNREGDMQFAVPIVGSRVAHGSALLKQKKHLAVARAERATARCKIADDMKSEDLLVECRGLED